MFYFLISGIVFGIILIFSIIYSINRCTNIYSNFLRIKNYDSYIATLEFHCKMAFDIIYKEQIMIYSIEATALDKKMLDKAMKDYLNLSLKFLGPNLIKEYIKFYGDDKSLFLNITNYFKDKYENDEIKKTSISNLVDS